MKISTGEAMVIVMLIAGGILFANPSLFLPFVAWTLTLVYVVKDSKERKIADREIWIVAAIILGIIVLPFYLLLRKFEK